MRRRRKRVSHEQPSLVPLADMLTNTLGISIFILIFTVLTAGGAQILRQLPMEQATYKVPIYIVCSGGRVLPQDLNSLASLVSSSDESPSSPYFNVTRDSVRLHLLIQPRPDVGESVAEIRQPGSGLRSVLAQHDTFRFYVNFLVYPDSIPAYNAARDLVRSLNFQTGWDPYGTGDPIRMTGESGGGRPNRVLD